jgi:hypothetical protein
MTLAHIPSAKLPSSAGPWTTSSLSAIKVARNASSLSPRLSCFPHRLPPLPSAHRAGIGPEPNAHVPGLGLCTGERLFGRIAYKVPGQTSAHKLETEVRAVNEDPSDGAAVAVSPLYLDPYSLTEHQVRCGFFGAAAEGLPVLRAINAFESNALGAAIVKGRNRVAVMDRDDSAVEFPGVCGGCAPEPQRQGAGG